MTIRRLVIARMLIGPLCLAALLAIPAHARAQPVDAGIRGTVLDTTKAVVPGATVVARHSATGLTRETRTGDDGRFVLAALPSGVYVLTAELTGFAPARLERIALNTGDQLSLTVRLHPAGVAQDITVAGASTVTNAATAVGTVIDRRFVDHLPLNGRSFQALIALVPGVVLTPASTSRPGHFSVSGARTNANALSIDGVSGNIGVTADANTSDPHGQEAAGTVPGVSALGTTHTIVSVEALEEFRVQTSSYSAEFGRQPGGQVSILTRSGTNRLSGAVYAYGRHHALDAANWFVNANGRPRARMHQRQFGGTIGGPVPLGGFAGERRLFFFGSYETLDLRQPRVISGDVPSLEMRAAAHPAVRPLLDAYPAPTEPENPQTRRARFVGSYSDPSSLHATSVRLDYLPSATVRLASRLNEARSFTSTGFIGFLDSRVNTRTLTTSITFAPGGPLVHDLRVNYSKSAGPTGSRPPDYGGAVPVPFGSTGHPEVPVPETAAFIFDALGQTIGGSRGRAHVQQQWQAVGTSTVSAGRHVFKAGADYRRLAPRSGPMEYLLWVSFNNPAAISSGVLSNGAISVNRTSDVTFDSFSAYVSDTWTPSSRLSIDAGLRWDVNTPPRGSYYTVTGADRLDTMRVAPAATPLYPTRWGNVAPRLGASHVLREHPSRGTIVRGATGLFYDIGAGAAAQVAGFFPYVVRKAIPAGTPYPLDIAAAQPPAAVPVVPPFTGQTFIAFHPEYRSPRTWQWSLALEQALGANQNVTFTYVGSAGRHLLRRQSVQDPNPDFRGNSLVTITRSVGRSEYDAFHAQYRRRLAGGLQALASYTLARSEDTESNDVDFTVRGDFASAERDLGPSDFDVRHVFSGALSWDIPSASRTGRMAAAARGWGLDMIVRLQSAAPVDVVVIRDLGFGRFRFRPDLVPGEPLYLHDRSLPGGFRINPAAFSVPADPRQGTLSRNSLRGFPLRQVDLSLRRSFDVGRARLQVRVDGFNALNTPNFAPPQPLLGSTAGTNFFPNGGFGRTSSMASVGLGGLHPLYQAGGPRSVQLSIRASF